MTCHAYLFDDPSLPGQSFPVSQKCIKIPPLKLQYRQSHVDIAGSGPRLSPQLAEDRKFAPDGYDAGSVSPDCKLVGGTGLGTAEAGTIRPTTGYRELLQSLGLELLVSGSIST